MARKLRGFERVLDAPSLFAVAYGEIASSLYIALGIVAVAALGLTPLVLLVTGAVFVLVFIPWAALTVPDIPVVPILAVAIPLMIVVPIVAYPWSKTVWMAIDRAFLEPHA